MVGVERGPALRRPLEGHALPAGRAWRLSNAGFGILIIVPALAVLLAVFVYPLLYSAYQSVRFYDLARPQEARFVGLDNYVDIVQGREFRRALKNTVIYAGVAVPIEFVFGLALALALSQITHGRGLIRMLLTLPMMLAPIALGLIWKFMYNDQLGIISYLIRHSGLERPPPLWLTDPDIALFSIIAVDIWATTPVVILILLAGLLSIPSDYYEAAKIDGGGTLSSFWHITLPLLKPAILVTLLLRGMDAFRVFDVVYVLTKGGPAFRTDVLSYYAYRLAFTERSVGDATALAWIMTLILLTAGLVLIRLMGRQEPAT
ncbi:MAG: carbohydrate ABC transporter permease [Thermomicrobiales bacterium]